MSGTEITRIKLTKKGRYALFCADGFLFSVDEDTLVRFGVGKGSRFEPGELEALRARSDQRRAESRALELLSAREHAERELARKLERSFDPETAARAVERMRALGLTDDARFARRYAEEMIGRRGKSRREVEQKLYEKGVPRETAQAALDGCEADERAALRALIDKKYRLKLAKPDGRRLVYAALLRRGFPPGDVREALESFEGQPEESFEEC